MFSAKPADRQPPGPCPRCLQPGHWARHCPNTPPADGSVSTRYNSPRTAPRENKTHRIPTARQGEFKPKFLDSIKCYCNNCNQRGHLASNCPQKALFCSLVPPPMQQFQHDRVQHRGRVNGIYTKNIVIDTGASKTHPQRLCSSQRSFGW